MVDQGWFYEGSRIWDRLWRMCGAGVQNGWGEGAGWTKYDFVKAEDVFEAKEVAGVDWSLTMYKS